MSTHQVMFPRQILMHLLWILPLAFWPNSTSYDATKFTILAISISGWLAHAAWQQWQGRPGLSLGNQSITIWGNLILVLSVGLFTSINPTLVIRTGLIISMFALVALLTSSQSGGVSGQTRLLLAITFAASMAGLYGILQMTHWLPGAPPNSGYPPGISTLGNQNYLSGFMAVALWPALILWRQTQLFWHKVLVIFSIIVMLSTLILAQATGPQLAVVVTLFVIVPCMILVSKNRSATVPFVLAGLLFFMAAASLWLVLAAPLNNPLLAENHGSIRRTDWLTAIEMLKSNPTLGVGAGNYLVQWPDAKVLLSSHSEIPNIPAGAPISTRAHNDFLQWIAETGSLGSFFLIFLLVTVARTWKRRFKTFSKTEQWDQLLIWGGLLTVLAQSMVSFPFHRPVTSLLFAFLIGLLFLKAEDSHRPDIHKMAKPQSFLLALLALAILGGGLMEFRGDLQTAKGRRLFTQGKMKEALVHLEKGIGSMKWPGHGRLHLGLVQTALGQTELAKENFKLSLKDKPSFEAHLALAESAINSGDYPIANDHLNLVIKCNPQFSFIQQAKFLRAFMLVRQNHLVSAHQEFEQLMKEDPNQHRALLGLGYLETQQGNPLKAMAYYRQAIEVIDRQVADFRINPGQESPAFLVRLQQNRNVAIKALNNLSDSP